MKIYEAKPDGDLVEQLIAFSVEWERENSCWGYRANGPEDIKGKRIFLAEEEGRLIGCLLGERSEAQNSSSIMQDGTPYFEVDEIYVVPENRGRGVGSALYRFIEEAAQKEGMEYVMLTTATKDFRRILHFYIDEMGMEFWSARLFKKIRP